MFEELVFSIKKLKFFKVKTNFSSQFSFQREEIAKQFVLPERKSKIATLLKQDGQEYCICRSSDSSRFMMQVFKRKKNVLFFSLFKDFLIILLFYSGCDACEEWYHGDCINITEKEAKYIKQFFCVVSISDIFSITILFFLYLTDI